MHLLTMFIFLQDSNKDSLHLCYRLSSTERIVIRGRGTWGYLNNVTFKFRHSVRKDTLTLNRKIGTQKNNANC